MVKWNEKITDGVYLYTEKIEIDVFIYLTFLIKSKIKSILK